MTSKLVVNTIEADTGISSVSFASSISMDSTSKFHFSAAGVDIGADTNINRPASGVLGFNINGSEKIRIDSSGRLGIGTNNPNHELTVYGDEPNIRLTHTGSTNTMNALYTQVDGTGVEWNSYQDGTGTRRPFIFKQYTTEVLRIASDGKIGINATSPNTELEIQSATDPKIRLQSQESGNKRLDLYVDGGEAVGTIAADQSSSQLAFRTAGSERLRITSDGNVLVGTTDSLSLIHI